MISHTFRILVLLIVTTLVGTACIPGGATPTPTPPPSICIDFEAPLTVGTQYGPAAGHTPGDLAFTANGIPVYVLDFIFTSTGGAFNEAVIDNASVPFGAGQSIRPNNINLNFDFSGVGFTPREVTLEFLDLGGFENISVDGSPIIAGELSTAPTPIGSIAVNVVTTPVTGGTTGSLSLQGPVKSLTVGGQELWIDNVCVTG